LVQGYVFFVLLVPPSKPHFTLPHNIYQLAVWDDPYSLDSNMTAIYCLEITMFAWF